MLVLSWGKGTLLAELIQPAASRAGALSQEGHARNGRREEEKKKLGSLPGAKDAAFPRAC